MNLYGLLEQELLPKDKELEFNVSKIKRIILKKTKI